MSNKIKTLKIAYYNNCNVDSKSYENIVIHLYNVFIEQEKHDIQNSKLV